MSPEKFTQEQAWQATQLKIRQALADYQIFLKTGIYPHHLEDTNPESGDVSLALDRSKGITFFPEKRVISKGGHDSTNLTPAESKTLEYLVVHSGRPITHEELYRAFYPDDAVPGLYYDFEEVTRPRVSRLRRKLMEFDPGLAKKIVNIRGAGYYWEEDQSR